MHRRSRAFTLIELLIVVAIIAILAAIAIPNFLEAQVRAKVSASQGNLRSLAVAIEAYAVDHNEYIPDSSTYPKTFLQRFIHLTTPVAYISQVPADPLVDPALSDRYFLETRGSTDASPYRLDGRFLNPATYDYACRRSGDTYEPYDVWARITSHPEAVMWAMRGVGPARIPALLGTPMPAYDPTNGTTSHGHLYWSGPGIGPDQPLVSQ